MLVEEENCTKAGVDGGFVSLSLALRPGILEPEKHQ